MADEGREGQRDWGGDTSSLGGYGSAGLFSRRRQMERTTGGSYQNLSNVSSGRATGGYVSMPTRGPESPIVEPRVSGHTGPIGPTKMAPGVAGNYNVAPPIVPKWGKSTRALGRAVGAAIVAYANRETPDEAPAEPPAEPVFPPPTGTPVSVRPPSTGLARAYKNRPPSTGRTVPGRPGRDTGPTLSSPTGDPVSVRPPSTGLARAYKNRPPSTGMTTSGRPELTSSEVSDAATTYEHPTAVVTTKASRNRNR